MCGCRYAAASVDDVQQDPREAAFSQLKTVTITGLQATHPPPRHTRALLRKAVAACVAMLDCLQGTLLGGVFLLIFSLFLSWYPSLKMTILSGGTAKPRYAMVNLTYNILW